MLLVAMIGLTSYTLWQQSENAAYERHIDSYVKQNYQNLVASVETISNDLSKLMVSGSEKQNLMLLTKIWDQADTASQNLSQIPAKSEQLRKAQKFINQLSDFSYAMVQKSFEGSSLTALTAGDLDLLRQLHVYSKELSEGLYNVDPDSMGVIAWKQSKPGQIQLTEETDQYLEDEAVSVFNETATAGGEDAIGSDQLSKGLETATDGLSTPFDSTMTKFEGRLSDMPKLIYDGPFSDHMSEGGLLKIKGPKVTEQDAKVIAAKFIDPEGQYPASQLVAVNLGTTQSATTTSPEPQSNLTYMFEYHMRDNATCYIQVTKNGGKIISTMCSQLSGKSNLSRKQAEKIASDYLKARGIQNMELTFSQKSDNTALMNFAATQGEVMMYPDLIKVRVSLDNGEIVGYDAANYAINHKTRTVTPSTIDPLKSINANGKIIGEPQLCYIPNDFGGESYCYEVKVEAEDTYFLFYVDVATGDVKNVLKLLIDENGTLTV